MLNSPDYVTQYRRAKNVDYNMPISGSLTGSALSTLEVDVTHYCAAANAAEAMPMDILQAGKRRQGAWLPCRAIIRLEHRS